MKTAMDFKLQFSAIRDVLKHHSNLWETEVLNGHPNTLKEYPNDWLEYLNNLSIEQIWQLDNGRDFSSLPTHEFLNWVNELSSLTQLESFQVEEEFNVPIRALFKIKQKKKHEISAINGLLSKLKIKEKFPTMTDIGGGIGHTSRLFSHYLGIESTCLEKNQELIKIGKEKFKHLKIPDNGRPYHYAQIDFGKNSDEEKKYFNRKTFSLGLHTCGPLANKHMLAHLKHQGGSLLNFGCCYTKLENPNDQNLSEFAKKSPIVFEKYALTLATRSHAEMTLEDFKMKERVKSFRYTLHLYLFEKAGKTHFEGIGNTPLQIYRDGDFAKYVEYNLKTDFNHDELNSFYEESKPLVRKMFHANIIRWRFGRLIEKYILLDRCLYLKEQGQKVEMKVLFDEKLSPRNIGILAIK